MAARVDPVAGQVRMDGQAWPFDLDLRSGTATVEVDGRPLAVRPLTWQEKLRLARHAHLGAEFLDRQLVRLCLDGQPVPDGPAGRALAAAARWLNDPDPADPADPLDRFALGRVAAEVCRGMGLRPGDLADREAAEVEEFYRAVARPPGPDAETPAGDTQPGDTQPGETPPWDTPPGAPAGDAPAGTSRIEVRPDPLEGRGEPVPTTAPAPLRPAAGIAGPPPPDAAAPPAATTAAPWRAMPRGGGPDGLSRIVIVPDTPAVPPPGASGGPHAPGSPGRPPDVAGSAVARPESPAAVLGDRGGHGRAPAVAMRQAGTTGPHIGTTGPHVGTTGPSGDAAGDATGPRADVAAPRAGMSAAGGRTSTLPDDPVAAAIAAVTHSLAAQPMTLAAQPMTAATPVTDATPPLTYATPPLTYATPPLTGAAQLMAEAAQPLTGAAQPLTGATQPVTGAMQAVAAPPGNGVTGPIRTAPLRAASAHTSAARLAAGSPLIGDVALAYPETGVADRPRPAAARFQVSGPAGADLPLLAAPAADPAAGHPGGGLPFTGAARPEIHPAARPALTAEERDDLFDELCERLDRAASELGVENGGW